MKRGFLNTPRSKRVIEEAYAPHTPPGPEPPTRGNPSPRHPAQDGSEEAVAAKDAVNVEMTAVEDLSDAGDRVVDDAKAEPPLLEDPKGKGKEMDVDTDEDDVPDVFKSPDDIESISILEPRPSPRRPGWGRHPDEDILHTVPESYGGPDVKRAVFRLWPRDRNAMALLPSEKPRGTLSPDGYPWGATLCDLYLVRRIPDFPNAMATMTGSAIWEAMRELGELDTAESEIEWAKSEGKPRVEGVANTGVLIECMERRMDPRGVFGMGDIVFERDPENGKGGQRGEQDEEHGKADVVEQAPEDDSGDKGDSNDEDHEEEEKDHDEEDEEASEHGDEEDDESENKHDDIKVDPHPSHCPKPRPPIPFENPFSILLQERIPLYLLPQTLYVHDPFNILPAVEKSFRDTSWLSRPDVILTYNLNLSKSIRKEVEEARRKAEEVEEFRARTLIIMRYKRTKEQIKNYEPMIEVPLPPYPRRMTKVEDSHLYLSPVAKVGDGHHSIVYKAEWELPRDVFIRPKLCQKCFEESVDKEKQRLKDTGRWEKLLRAAAWGLTGFTGRLPTQAELDDANDPINLEKNGEIIERELTFVVSPDTAPSDIFDMVEEGNMWDLFTKQKNAGKLQVNFVGDGDEGKSTKGSYVATIRLDPPFSYESQKACTHGSRYSALPRTARFTVVAKLSIEADAHLAREASNYQCFPERFFHHYNGYTIIGQLHTVVPVHAVVPQFYGYYTPGDGAKKQTKEPYLSPILLLEHCGEPIEPEKLSIEDQDECASLLLRFQRAGWLHESVAPRNFLVQYGKPTEFPLTRGFHPESSFRLIDFGRSRKFDTAESKRAEEMEALHMFKKLYGKMNVTLSL